MHAESAERTRSGCWEYCLAPPICVIATQRLGAAGHQCTESSWPFYKTNLRPCWSLSYTPLHPPPASACSSLEAPPVTGAAKTCVKKGGTICRILLKWKCNDSQQQTLQQPETCGSTTWTAQALGYHCAASHACHIAKARGFAIGVRTDGRMMGQVTLVGEARVVDEVKSINYVLDLSWVHADIH